MSQTFIRAVVNAARKERLTYHQFISYCQRARHKLGLTKPRASKKLKQLIPADALRHFYDVIDHAQNIQHQIMLRLLFYTALRVDELCSIRLDQVALEECKIFVELGKGQKDRYVLFPESFRLVMQSHIKANKDNRYLFESNRKSRYSTRQVERIVKQYARDANMPVNVHPHLLRHQCLTFLTSSGLTDAKIQLISGHSTKKSLEVYQHMGLNAVADDYQQAMKKVGV